MVAKDLDAEAHHQASEDGDDEGGLDLDRIKELGGFALRAPRRRPKLASSIVALGIATTFAMAALLPRTYSTEVRILAQRNLVLPALGNPNRAVPREADAPTKNVADTIMRRENLISLIKQTALVDRWAAQRPPILRAKDSLAAQISSPPSEEDQLRALVGVLEKRIAIVNDDTTVTITVEWWNAQMAFELASLVQKNFFDAKYDADVGMINDAIGILREHEKVERAGMEAAQADYERILLEATRAAQASTAPTAVAASATAAPAPTSATPAAPRPPPTDRAPGAANAPSAAGDAEKIAKARADLTKLLEEKRATIKQIEEAHQQRVAELNRQISEALVTLAPAHPTVVALKQRLDVASRVPPELEALRSDEQAIVQQLAAFGTTPPASPSGGSSAPGPVANRGASRAAPASSPAVSDRQAAAQNDPAVIVARFKLQDATNKHNEIAGRIDAAQMELDIARAAFKYRFSILRPAEVPEKPKKPNAVALVVGGVVGTILLALLMSALADLLSGRFIEPWQARRRLRLPVLGEMKTP